jgi:uncharacterized protein with HEPN domain
MSRDYDLFLEDIVDSGRFILVEMAGISLDQLRQDRRRRDSLFHNLLVIGEATKQLPEELRQQCPEVNWRGLARLRDLIAHGYFKANLEIIWHDIHTHLPGIVASSSSLLQRLRQTGQDREPQI